MYAPNYGSRVRAEVQIGLRFDEWFVVNSRPNPCGSHKISDAPSSRLRAFRYPWREAASESELTRAARDDLFDIVAATNDQLLEELLALLAKR